MSGHGRDSEPSERALRAVAVRLRGDIGGGLGLGGGATFTVTFPVQGTGEGVTRAAPAPETLESAPPVLTGLAVLVVDDEEGAREMLRVVLGEHGAEVRTAAGSAQALDHLAQWTPDVLVSDIGMPGEDGHALIQHVRALPRDRGGRVPAVALTASVKPEDRMWALAACFQTQVPKPLDPDEVALVIARLAGLTRPPAS